MNKKEFYVAPEWGTRVVTVERHIMEGTIGSADGDYDGEGNNLGDLVDGE